MKNAFPSPRAIVGMLLDTALLSILLAVVFTILPDRGASVADVFPAVLGVAAMVFRLDAHVPRDLVTRKRVLVAGLASFWGVFIATAGQSIVGGHYVDAGAFVCISLICLLPIGFLLRSAPEQWLGENWQQVVKA